MFHHIHNEDKTYQFMSIAYRFIFYFKMSLFEACKKGDINELKLFIEQEVKQIILLFFLLKNE